MPSYTEEQIRRKANYLVERLDGADGAVDAQKVAELYDISVLFADFDNNTKDRTGDKVAAFYCSAEEIIYVNNELDGREKNFAIAVELGKFLLHPDWVRDQKKYKLLRRSKSPKKQEELDAHLFARTLLVPRSYLTLILTTATLPTISKLFVLPPKELAKELAEVM